MFSIVIGVCTLCDIYYLADKEPFINTSDSFYKFMMGVNIFSDIISFVGVSLALGSVFSENKK